MQCRLLKDRVIEDDLLGSIGDIVIEYDGHDYGLAREDTEVTGIEHISVPKEKDLGFFFTIPLRDLEIVVEEVVRLAHVEPKYTVDDAIEAIKTEVAQCQANWPDFNSAHEGFAVLNEEVDELWDHIRTNQKRRDLVAMRKEAIQVAAMAVRFATEVCDEINGKK